ncbi:hypothetical protein CPC08DRAFT_784864 [Agrocybe pediades]|nr:hypothetical protein CPC08DRAFT_784864 [Agrocybe pediades]
MLLLPDDLNTLPWTALKEVADGAAAGTDGNDSSPTTSTRRTSSGIRLKAQARGRQLNYDLLDRRQHLWAMTPSTSKLHICRLNMSASARERRAAPEVVKTGVGVGRPRLEIEEGTEMVKMGTRRQALAET